MEVWHIWVSFHAFMCIHSNDEQYIILFEQ